MSSFRWPLAILTGALGGWLAARSHSDAAPPHAGAANPAGTLSARLRQAAADSPVRPGERTQAASAILQRVDGELAASQALVERIAASGADALPALFREIRNLPHDSMERVLAWAAFWQRCVETDPLAAAAWVRKDAPYSLSTLAAYWLRIDRAAAMAWIREQPFDSSDSSFLLCEALSTLVPSAQTDLLADILQPDSGLAEANPHSAIYELAKKDPAEAQRLFESLPGDNPHRGKLAKTIAQNLAARDFDTAKAWVDQLPPGPMREDALRAALSQAVFRDSQRVLHELETAQLPAAWKKPLKQSVAAALASRDPQAALNFLKTLPDDPNEGQKFDLALPDLPVATLQALMTEWKRVGMSVDLDWTGRDPAADLKAAEALPEGPGREQLLRAAEGALLRRGNPSPEDIAALPAASRSRLAKEGLELAWQSGNAQTARAWAASFPELDYGDYYLIKQADEMTRSEDPAMSRIGAELLQRVSPSRYARDILARIQAESRYHSGGAEEAREYALSLPPAEQATALGVLMSQARVEGDPAVLGWAGQFPPGPASDAYAGSLSMHYATTDPAAALTWARSIGEPEVRKVTIAALAGKLLADDYHTGLQFLAQAGLSPEEQAAVELQKAEIKP